MPHNRSGGVVPRRLRGRDWNAGLSTWNSQAAEIVERSDRAGGFVVQANRWIVERTLAWISRNRGLARDFENLARTAKALIYLAMIKLMLRRLARA